MVSREEGSEFAQQVGALFMECSAKTREGVVAAFEEIVHRMARQRKSANTGDEKETVGLAQTFEGSSGGCC